VKLHGTVGPAKTTVSGIAREAGVQRATVYRHFADEEAIYEACSSHYNLAIDALGAADPDWLERLITRRVPLERWREALGKGDHDIKVVVEVG